MSILFRFFTFACKGTNKRAKNQKFLSFSERKYFLAKRKGTNKRAKYKRIQHYFLCGFNEKLYLKLLAPCSCPLGAPEVGRLSTLVPGVITGRRHLPIQTMPTTCTSTRAGRIPLIALAAGAVAPSVLFTKHLTSKDQEQRQTPTLFHQRQIGITWPSRSIAAQVMPKNSSARQPTSM